MDFFVAALVAFAASGLFHTIVPFFNSLLNWFSAHQHKRIEAQAAVAAKKAIDGNAILEHLSNRVDKLETDREADRIRLDAAEKRGDRLERILERVARGYDEMHKHLMRLVRFCRAEKKPEADYLDELEKTPGIKEMLEGVLKID